MNNGSSGSGSGRIDRKTYQSRISTQVVFSGAVCDELIGLGEVLLHVRPDLKMPANNVFVFKNSDTFSGNLQEAIRRQEALNREE